MDQMEGIIMKGSDLLLRCLENEGVQWIFGVPGGRRWTF